MPKLQPAPSPWALLTDTMMELSSRINIKEMLPESAMDGAVKFKHLALFYLAKISMLTSNLIDEIVKHTSKLSDNQIAFVLIVLIGMLISLVVLYYAFINYVLRPAFKKCGMEFGAIHFSILGQSFGFSNLVILPLETPVLSGIFGAIFPSAVVKQLEKSDDYPPSKIVIRNFRIKLRIGALTGKFTNDTKKSMAQKFTNFIGRFIPRPMIVIKLSDVVLTVEKSYLAPDAPPEYTDGRIPFAIPPPEERDPRLPTFDQDPMLEYFRNDEINAANGMTYWIERWINHAVAKLKNNDKPTDDEKTNSTMRSIFRVVLHSIAIHLHNASLVISGADTDLVKLTRENHSPTEANLILAKLPKAKRSVSVIGAQTLEIAFSSDDECNLFLCCAGVHIKVGSPYKTKGGEMVMTWGVIAHPFDVIAELRGLIDIIIWAMSYDHHFDSKSIDLLITVSELAMSISPKPLHTLLLHLGDFIDANSPFNDWFAFLQRNHVKTLIGLSDDEKMSYCEKYPSTKTKKVKGKEANKKILEEINDMEKKMKRLDIISLRCFAMREELKIPKEFNEFSDYLNVSGSSIVKLPDPLQHTPEEILNPFGQVYPSPLHALGTLVQWKNALVSLLKIRYVARQLHIDLPSEFNEFGVKKGISKRRVTTSLTSTGVELELEKRDPLLHISDLPTLKLGFSIKEVEWRVIGLDSEGDKLPTLANNDPVGIMYKQQKPVNERALSIELKMKTAPTRSQDTMLSLNLVSSDLIIVVNPIPLLSALQTLLDASDVPFQAVEEQKPEEVVKEVKTEEVTPKLELALSDEENDEDIESGPLDTLSTDIDIKVEQISIVLLLNGTSSCEDVLHFDVKDIGITLDSQGMNGMLTLAAEPFELHPGQVVKTEYHPFAWKLLPFEPILSIRGVRMITTTKEIKNKKKTTLDVDFKQGVEYVNVTASPLTLAALSGAMDSLQPFLAPDENYDAQLKAEELAKRDEYRSNLLKQRHVLRHLFNSLDKDESHTLQDFELEQLIRMLMQNTSGSNLPTTNSAIGLTTAELSRETSFLLSVLDSKGRNEVTLPDLEKILFQLARNIDDSNLKTTEVDTGVSYLDDITESNQFLSGPSLRHIVHFDDLKEYTAMHHVFRLTGHDDIDKKSSFPPLSTWIEGVELFWDFYSAETGCSRDSLNGQDMKLVQQKLVRSLCNYEFAKFCWKGIVQPQFYATSPFETLSQESSLWLLDNDHKCKPNEGILNLLLKELRSSAQIDEVVVPTSNNEYSISVNFVVDNVMLCFGSPHSKKKSLVEVELSLISMSSNALLSESGFLPGSEDQNQISFRSNLSAQYLNTSHGFMESLIAPYPTYGSVSYHLELNNDGSETSSVSGYLNCPHMLNIGLGFSLLETASALSDALSPKETSTNHEPLFAGCQKILIKNNTGREMKVSTNRIAGNGVLTGLDKSFTSIGVDSSAYLSLPEDDTSLSFYADRYKLIDNVPLSPYRTMMFPLLRRKKQQGRSKQKQAPSGFGSFLTLVPKSDSLCSLTIELRSCITIQTLIPVNVRIVRLPKNLGYLSKKGMKSAIDLTKKNLVPALKRLVNGALIVFEKSALDKGDSCAVPADLVNSMHYYALLIQDITANNDEVWRDPILLTQDYLFNTMDLSAVSRSHSLSGISVKKERLDVQVPSKRHDVNNMLLRTAWDSCIKIVPTFYLANSMPFPLSIRVWQFTETNDDTIWIDQANAEDEDESSGDENQSSSLVSTWVSNVDGDKQYHNPPERSREHHYAEEHVKSGATLRLSGINLQKQVYIQVSQQINVSGSSGTKYIWSSPVSINLTKLKTGANKKGSLSLPLRTLDLGDDADAVVDTSVDPETGMPATTIYSPYWVVNKTGMKIGYKVPGDPRRFIDSGKGGLPIMLSGGKHSGMSAQTNTIYKKSSSKLQFIPIECPQYEILSNWWDNSSSGTLVLKGNSIKNGEDGQLRVGWSDAVEMDTAGTSGKISCGRFVLSAQIESLVGAFYKTNLITLGPHYILKNLLHIEVSMIPLSGSQHDAIQMTKKLRLDPDLLAKKRVILSPDESSVVYSFNSINSVKSSSNKWIAFTVNAVRSRQSFEGKWHLIPVDLEGQTHYGEYDGLHSTMCGILEVKTHRSSGGSMAISISHSANPPFIIENRSCTHFLQFAQDDADSAVFELPPLQSCGYTWDSPLGNKRLRATVVRKEAHHFASLGDHQLARIDEGQEYDGSLTDVGVSAQSSPKKKFSSFRSKGKPGVNTGSVGSVSKLSRGSSGISSSSSVLQKFKDKFDGNSRTYSLSKVGRKKDLPLPKKSSHLNAHLRIISGAKILSFNDSDYLAQQVESGIMRDGGSFKNALIQTNIQGMQLTILDTFPRELLGVTVRDVQIIKPRGSIEATFRVRHFQIDALLSTARYPIIIQPLPLGVDRRMNEIHQDSSQGNLDKKDLYWLEHAEKPVPVLEIVSSYVPQSNMVWIPDLYVMISPCQVNVDVEYILGIVGMMLYSLSKSNLSSTSTSYCPMKHSNTPLQFVTQGQSQASFMYLEKLYIAPVYFDMEIDIKDETQEAEEGALTLDTIARSTTSSAAAGILTWIINVGANFAHVSPCFKYSDISYADKYCDLVDVIYDIVISYVMSSIQQSYKVIFSMELLGDPSLLAHEWKTGVTDLVSKTSTEVKAGGTEGAGKGFLSFLHHAVGGTFLWMGKASGAWAKTLDSVASNDSTSTHLKPQFSTYRNRPKNAAEGLVQGTTFVANTVVYGVAGLIGNPYRGMKSGGVVGAATGTLSGVTGLVSTFFVAPLGFVAKTSEGIGASTKCLEIGVINTRCRPIRSVPWGSPMIENGLSYMKAIAIRVHTVRYQKVRQGAFKGTGTTTDEMRSFKSSKELKRIRTAEERRKNPPRKIVTIFYNKDKRLYSTYAHAPKLLLDQPQEDELSHYAVVFQDTIVIRVSDLQLSDEVTIQFRNNKTVKSLGKMLGTCKVTVGDMYSFILHNHKEQMIRNDNKLAQNVMESSNALFQPRTVEESSSDDIIIPSPQEYQLFRSPKTSTPNTDMFDLVRQELVSIQRDEEERLQDKDDDSYDNPDSLFGMKTKKNEASGSASSNEKLFGTISLSFFPIVW